MKGYFSLSYKIIILEIKILFPLKTIIPASFVCFLKSEIIKLSFWQKKRDNFRNSRKKMRALRGRRRFLKKKFSILEKVIFSQEK
jgi:hypothetical protein